MICLDASVALKWAMPEIHSDRAARLRLDARRAGEGLVAPPLFRFELTNALRRRMLRNGLPLDAASLAIGELMALPVTLLGFDQLHPRALEIADAYGLPATYDAHYVALAELLGCDFWTADERLVATLSAAFPFVRWIGSYPTA